MDTAAPSAEITVCAAADLHGELPEIASCQLLVLAGDLVPYAVERDPERTVEWFATTFTDWLTAAPAAEVVGIAGNHDFWAEEVPAGVHERLFGAPWTYLRDAETTTSTGLRIYGTPWTPDVYGTALEAPGAELEQTFSQIPTGLDILAAHCPPRGFGDHLAESDGSTRHMGSSELLAAIRRARPRLVLFGHAHEAYGYRAEEPAGTELANVTVRTDYTAGLYRSSAFSLTPG